MAQVNIRTSGNAPTMDGDIGEFRSAEAASRNWFNPGRRVIFVNGMDNTGQDHLESARALSLLQGCPVLGVFNRTDGVWSDLGQCLTDKINLVSAQAGAFSMWASAVDAAYDALRQARPGLSKADYVGGLIAGNRATLSLYNLLISLGPRRRQTPIFCHSQGNLITSNALTAVALAQGEAAIAGQVVYSFGSPCRYWPRGLRHTQRAFTLDPVTWLDLRVGLQFDKVGFVAAHGFLEYLRHDGEFTVNRFRWGGMGLTARMDEEGLADYCITIGNNPDRLLGIFRRLFDAHWSDSDDVAHIYCRRMRERHTAAYQAILRGSPAVGNLLIDMLEEGITTSGERAEISFIQSII